MKMRGLVYFSLASWLAVTPVMAQDRTVEHAVIDAMVEETFTRYDLPGLAVAVVANDNIIYQRTLGETKAGSGEQITSATIFKIASNSKAMTTALLARLVDAGKLHWDDPVSRYLPNFRLADPLATRELQVRDLLIHNTGLAPGAGDLMLWPEPNTFTRADLLAGIAHLKPAYSFRSRYGYDNLLYVVAGEVATVAGGADFETLLQREVFAPLGLSRCQVGAWRRDEVGNVAQPHMRDGQHNRVIRADAELIPMSTSAAAGGIRCSLDDMMLWARQWLRDDNTWLSAEQRKALWTPQILLPLSDRQKRWDHSHFYAYGYGWRLSDVDGQLKVSHTGTLAGMYSVLTLLPESKTGFVILTNGDGDVARTVLNQALVKHFTAPEQKRTVAAYADELTAVQANARAATPVDNSAADVRSRATAESLGNHLGIYRDAWFGEISLCRDGASVRFRSDKSARLTGILFQTNVGVLVHWDDASVDSEAWLHFAEPPTPTFTMTAVAADSDSSFDWRDLAFERVGDCPIVGTASATDKL